MWYVAVAAEGGLEWRGQNRDLGDGSPPAGSRGGGPVGGLGDEVPQKLNTFCNNCTRISRIFTRYVTYITVCIYAHF